MKRILILIISLLAQISFAQKTKITIQAAPDLSANVSVAYYELVYTPTSGVSLFDTRYESLIYFNTETQKTESALLNIVTPEILVVTINSKQKAVTKHVFICPKEQVTVKLDANLNATFEGNLADYEDFLQKHLFTERPFDNLPKLGYQPNKSENWDVVQKVDSLQKARKNGLEALKAKVGTIKAPFDAYIQALMMTDSYLYKEAVIVKKNRDMKGTKLSPEETKATRKLCLDNFKILPDDALLSNSYRQELKKYVMLSAVDMDDTTQQYMSGSHLRKAYDYTIKHFATTHPAQCEYLLTHWLDFASGISHSPALSQELFYDYKTRFMNAILNDYFDNSIKTRQKLTEGNAAPDFKLKDKDNKELTVSSFAGKPTLLVFTFALRQHEASLKVLEEKYGAKINVVYISLTPRTSYEGWLSMVQPRPNITHLWASDADAEKIRPKYLLSMAYPFVLLDGNGKIIKRWIPHEFPTDKTLAADLAKLKF